MGRLVDQTDVFIVGAGPAGLAAGIAARKKGFRVIAADCAVPPIDKTCGEGLMPDGLSALRQLGVTVNPEESFEFRGIRFLGSGTSVEAVFPFGRGLGVRRTLLHQILIDQAEAAGIPIRWGERITGITENAVQLVDGEIRCRWIVGADGENSRVRRWGGLDAVRRHSRRFGFRQHYSIEPWTDYMEIYWGDDSQIYVTPVARESVCVALISPDPHVRLSTVLPRCPDLCRRLAEAAPSDVERGAVSASRALRSVTRNHVALIGDASGSVDAITGEGLCLSFHQ